MTNALWIAVFFSLCGFCSLLSWKRPGVAIGLLFCIFGIEALLQAKSAFFVDNGRYVNLGIGAVVAIGALGCLFRNPKSLTQLRSVEWLVLGLFVYGFVSFMWTLAPEQRFRWTKSLPYCGTYLLLAPILMRQKNALADGLRWALLIGVPVLVLMAFFSQWGNRGLILSKPIISDARMYTETTPLATASMGAMLAIIALVAHFNKAIGPWLRFLVFGLGLYVAFRTESRGQVLAIFAVSAIVYPISNRATNAKGALITAVGFIAVGLIAYFLIQNLALARWGGTNVEDAFDGRTSLTKGLLEHWMGNVGISTVFGFGACSAWRVVGGYPHNLPIEILFEFGLIGFAIFVAVVVTSAQNGLRLLSQLDQSPELRSQIVALIGMIGLLFAECLKSGTLYNWQSLFFLLICLDQQVRLKRFELGARKRSWKILFVQPGHQRPVPAPQRHAF